MTVMVLQLTSFSHAAQTTLTWDPPVNADGTPFTGVSGYKLHVGSASRSYAQTIDVGNTTTYAMNNLSEGSTYYFTVTDYDGAGNESGYSNEISKSFPFTYSLTATAGAGGTISPVGNVTTSTATSGTSIITSMTVSQGGSQSFSIIPNAGYSIANVTVDGVSVGAVSTYTFTNVTADHAITATFASFTASSTFTVTATASTGGSISPSGTATLNSGGSQAYTITPNVGYYTVSVIVDGTVVASNIGGYNYTFSNITANHSISATFGIATYTIAASAGTGGSISPVGTTRVNYGTSQSYTITPAAGYSIASVTVDGSSVGAVSSYTFSNVNKNHTIAATFAPATISSYTITASAGTGGSISPNGTTTINSGGSQAYTITPNVGYYTVSVTVDGAVVASNMGSYNYTFSNVTANHTIAATFGVATYAIAASAGTGGSISPTGTTTVNYGTSKTYTIAPATGYSIAGVTVDGVSVGAVASYTFSSVNANHTIAATFVQNNATPSTYSITASTGTNGSITPAGTATVNNGASQTYTITPASGYKISSVTVDGVSVGAVASYTFSNVKANHTIKAIFKRGK